jgi:hypothetical protein
MLGSTIQRYIHIDDFGPVGFDNGPDDAAFAAARAALAATGYRTLVIGSGQYWLQNGFNLNAYADANGILYPALPNVLITSDSSLGVTTQKYPVYSGLPATIVLSPGYADPTVDAYTDGSEPCRTTGSIKLSDSSSIANVRIISLTAYQFSLAVARGYDNAMLADALVCGPTSSMSVPVSAANGMLGVSAGGGTALQFDGSSCSAYNIAILGFRNGIVSVPLLNGNASGDFPFIGPVLGDCANLVRIDGCVSEGRYPGPINQDNLLTESLKYSFMPQGIMSDANGGTDFLFGISGSSGNGTFGSTKIPTASPGIGQEFTVTVIVEATQGPCYNAANLGRLNPVGNPMNRYIGTITGLPTTSVNGTLNFPGIPLSSFYDATCLTAGIVKGNLDGSTYETLTVSAVETGAVAAGQWVTPSVYIESVDIEISGAISTITCTLTGALSSIGTGTTTFNLTPGVLATGSISGTTLVASGITGGTLAAGQLVTGAGIFPGTTISGGGPGSGTYTVVVPQVAGPAVFTAMSAGAETVTLTGTISGTVASLGSGAQAGQVLSGSGILPGSYLSTTSRVGVFQEVGSGTPVSITAIAGAAVFGAVITPISGTNSSSVSVVGSVAVGTLSPNMMVLGAGIPENTYFQGTSTGTINGALTLGSPTYPLTVIAVPAVTVQGSIAGAVLTVTEVAGTLALPSVPLLIGTGVVSGTYLSGFLSGTLTAGNYSLAVAQYLPASPAPTPLIAIPTAIFQGSIAGSTLYPAPTGTLVSGQEVFFNSAAGSPTLSTITSVTSANTYELSSSFTATGAELMTAVSAGSTLTTATFTGTIGNSVAPTPYLTVAAVNTGTLTIGQQVIGPGINSPTYITGPTGEGGVGVYTLTQAWSTPSEVMLAVPPTSSNFSGTITGTTLVVPLAAISSGALAPGQALIGNGISAGTWISTTATTSGGTNTYTIAPPQGTITGQMAGLAAPPVFTGSISGNTLSTTPTSLSSSTTLTGSGISPGTTLTGAPGSYTVSEFQTIGTQLEPITIFESNSSQYVQGTGSIAGTVLTFTFTGTVSPLIGDIIVGSGLLQNTIVSSAGTTVETVTTCSTAVFQQVQSTPLIAMSVHGLIAGSISGTTLSISNFIYPPQSATSTPTLAVHDVLLGQGVAFGSYITGTTTVGSTISYKLAVPQFVGNSTSSVTVSAVAGECVAGSISGSILDVGAVSYGTLSQNKVITGAGVLTDTTVQSGSVVAGSSGTVTLKVEQAATNVSILALNPIPTSTITGNPKIVSVQFSALGVRPGRTMEINNCNQSSIGALAGFAAGTILRVINSESVQLLTVGCDCNQNDLLATVLDVQGSAGNITVGNASVINVYTFVNDESTAPATSAASVLRLLSSSASMPPGGILINQQGANLIVVGGIFGGGLINIGPEASATRFNTTEFALGSAAKIVTSRPPDYLNFLAAPTFSYAMGSPVAKFDQSCSNVPQSGTVTMG